MAAHTISEVRALVDAFEKCLPDADPELVSVATAVFVESTFAVVLDDEQIAQLAGAGAEEISDLVGRMLAAP